LRPIALHAVSVCHEAAGLPIVGMGGIETGRDALEFAACGARDIALGTVLFADPGASTRVRAELASACAEVGVVKPEDARSLAKSPETVRKVPA
jgi:dihydroorotate dehydrogenase (NAD+) catalytic subunit